MVRRRWIWILLAALLSLAAGWRISLAKGLAASTGLNWQPTLDDAKRLATQTNRLILVHFWAPSCKECAQLEKNVFSQPQVQQAINARFVPLKLNADDFPTTTKQYGVDRLPTDLIITPAGQILGRMKCPLTPDAYLQQLNIAASGTGPAEKLSAAPGTTAPPAPVTAGMNPATALAPPANVSPAQPPLNPPAATVNSQVGAVNPVMSNPSWAMQPPTNATAAIQPTQGIAQPIQGAVAAMQPAKSPAVPAYSDGRYAEYFQRFSSSGTPAASATPATSPAGMSMPQYNPPPTNPVQYTSPAVGQGLVGGAMAPQVSLPAPVTWPSTPSPALTSATATQPYTGPSMAGVPSATITGLTGASPAATQAASATSPPVGLDGYCPVTLVEQKRWQVGDRRFGVIHRGCTYLFAGPVEQQKFLSNPDRYSPAISGQDVVVALEQGQTVEGRRQYGVEYQGRTYLFASDASRRAFSQNPKRYAAEVLQAENPNRPPLR